MFRDAVVDYDLNVKNEIMFVTDILLGDKQNKKGPLQQTIDNYSSDEDSCIHPKEPNKGDEQKDNIVHANNTKEASQLSSELLSIEDVDSLGGNPDQEVMYTNQEYAGACLVSFRLLLCKLLVINFFPAIK